MKTTVKLYHSDRLFSSSAFSTATSPTHSKLSEIQYRIDGEQGLGRGWALVYQLRAAQITKRKHNNEHSAGGLQDQEIGLARGIHQDVHFADALVVNAIVPTGSTSSDPRLGVGAWAVEPDYAVGGRYKLGSIELFGCLSLGPRIYVGDGVTQVRVSTEEEVRPLRRVTLFSTFFLSKTLAGSALAASTTPGAAEFYNIFRGGVGVKLDITKNVRPFLAYEADLAGQKIHAGDRLEVGISWQY